MKEFINKIKNMDKTKRIVILFITISFVFIGGFSIYNGVTGNYKTNQVAQVDTTKNKKEKILRKLKKKRNKRQLIKHKKQVNLRKVTVNHQHNQQMKQKQMMKINQIVNHHLQLKAIVKVVVQVILKVLRINLNQIVDKQAIINQIIHQTIVRRVNNQQM